MVGLAQGAYACSPQSTELPVGHRDEVEDLIRKGRDTERLALARAVRLHLKRQVIVYRGRTAVFE